jgi:nicotinamidase-related amidase
MSDTALLIMDVQNGITGRIQDPDYIPRVARAVDAARAAGIPVRFVVVGFRPGHPESSPNNKTFSAFPPGAFLLGDESTQVHPDVAPRDGEPVIVKKRVSAFAGSDLDVLLRAGGVRHVVLAGIATGGVVLSTVRQAADLDYRITVLEDGCADADPEIHRVLTEKVFPRQAEVVTVDQWVKSL